MKTINLNGYSASTPNSLFLNLGTCDSYGIEQLQIITGPEWQGLTITVTFSAGGTALAPPIVVPENGIIDVPPGATARALPVSAPGVIVFRGVSDGVQRISTNILYTVLNHGPVDGTAPAPTPSEWEQYIQQVQEIIDTAVPPDGTPGYVLTKTEDGTEWADPQGGGGGTTDYEKLTNKPQINSVELSGNKSLQDLGAQPAGDYAERSEIPTKTSQLKNDSGFLIEEADPTVPEWAKSPQKPSYTPQEIGAQPAGDYTLKSEIPTKLPNPNTLTFSGAASGSYDGSETVNINIPEVSGIPGKAATIQVGTVTTGEAGTQANVTNSGNETDAVFNFTIPKGDNGKTPVKGVDYYTEADKQKMVQAVIAALPNGDEVSY